MEKSACSPTGEQGWDWGSHRVAAVRVTVEVDKQHQQMLNPWAKVLGSRRRDSLPRSLNYKGERRLHSGARRRTPLTQVAGRGAPRAGQAALACPPPVPHGRHTAP